VKKLPRALRVGRHPQGGLPIGPLHVDQGGNIGKQGKTIYSLHFFVQWNLQKYGEPGIFVTFEESPI